MIKQLFEKWFVVGVQEKLPELGVLAEITDHVLPASAEVSIFTFAETPAEFHFICWEVPNESFKASLQKLYCDFSNT